MKKYLYKVKEITLFFFFEIVQILGLENSQADLLSRLAIMEYPEIYKGAYMENLEKSSIEGKLALVM